jgi:hypothetical protein
MTVLAARAHGSAHEKPDAEVADPAAASLVLRLRDAAAQMVAFSQVKTLLREAASMIERLEAAERLNRAGPR